MKLKQYDHKKYNRDGLICYKDPIRNVLIQATPEERVRQDLIKTLIEYYEYPAHALESEYLIKLKNKKMRADIVVWLPTDKCDDKGRRIEQAYIVVECKNSNVPLTQEIFEQGATYCDELGAEYLVITNGNDFWIYRYNEKTELYNEIEDVPHYSQALLEGWVPTYREEIELIERPVYELLRNREWLQDQYKNVYSDWIIGLDTDEKYWSLIIDFHHLLLSPFPYFTKPIDWLGYTFYEDIGVSLHSFGNSAGGQFFGKYRSFVVRDRVGNDTIIRFMICAVGKTKNDPVFGNSRGSTYLNVAVCSGEKMHNSLQLRLDDFVIVKDKVYSFTHDGRMNVGKLGRAKNQRVVDFLRENESSLVKDLSIFLGEIPKDTQLEWEQVKSLLLNLAVYALLRDDLRNIITIEKQGQKPLMNV